MLVVDETLNSFLFFGLVALVLLVVASSVLILQTQSLLKEQIVKAEEAARPGKIELIQLSSSCDDCFNIDAVVNSVKSAKVELINEKQVDASSEEGKELVKKYGIEKLPSLIVTGELDKVSLTNFVKQEDALIFNGVKPPYEDANGNVVGKVSATILSAPSCELCTDFTLLINQLVQTGIVINKVETFEWSEKKDLIEKYAVKKAPAVLISKDIDAYPEIAQNLKQMSTELTDYYVLESNQPYVNTSTGKVKGLLKLTLLTDDSCTECYDIEILKTVLYRLGLAISEEETFDVNSAEGKTLVKQHDIEAVPAGFLTGDLNEYVGFEQAWINVGSVADDVYVFRKPEILSPELVYKNLTTNELVNTKEE